MKTRELSVMQYIVCGESESNLIIQRAMVVRKRRKTDRLRQT